MKNWGNVAYYAPSASSDAFFFFTDAAYALECIKKNTMLSLFDCIKIKPK